MTGIVILGDCSSNGNNALAHEVTNTPDLQMTFSLQYHNLFNVINKWFLEKRKQGEFLDYQIDHPYQIQGFAQQALREKQKQIAWPALLPYDVTNYSVNGNHFSNYVLRLKQHVVEFGKPDFLLITDYSVNHKFIRFRYNNQYYKFLATSYMNRKQPDQPFHTSVIDYPREVFDIEQRRRKIESNKTDEQLMRKSRRSFRVLMNLVEELSLPFATVNFHEEYSDIMQKYDCLELIKYRKQWHVNGNEFDGEYCALKKELQKPVAEQVKNFLSTRI